MEFKTTTVGDMLEGFVDNMSEEQIDEELKLFEKIAKELKMHKADYDKMGVLIDEDHLIGYDEIEQMVVPVLGYSPYREQNRTSGYIFLYFETPQHAEIAAAVLAPLLEQ